MAENWRGVGALSGLMEGVGGASDGGGGRQGRGIAIDIADQATDGLPPLLPGDDAASTARLELLADVLLEIVLLAAVLVAVVGAAPESMMTALLIRAKPMVATLSPSLVLR